MRGKTADEQATQCRVTDKSKLVLLVSAAPQCPCIMFEPDCWQLI